MEEELNLLKSQLVQELANCQKEADVLNVKSKFVGKKSRMTELLKNLKDMSIEDKKKFGSLINITKQEME